MLPADSQTVCDFNTHRYATGRQEDDFHQIRFAQVTIELRWYPNAQSLDSHVAKSICRDSSPVYPYLLWGCLDRFNASEFEVRTESRVLPRPEQDIQQSKDYEQEEKK